MKWHRKLLHRRSPAIPDWLEPGQLSVWALAHHKLRLDGHIFAVGREWAAGGMCGVQVRSIWLHEYDTSHWEDDKDLEDVRNRLENPDEFAAFVVSGELCRIGPLPSMPHGPRYSC